MSEFSPTFPDEFDRLMRLRRDVRHFVADRAPDPVLIEQALSTFRLAPSVGLSEPWRIVLVTSPGARAKARANFQQTNAEALAGYAGDDARRYATLKLAGFDDAPTQLVVCCDEATTKGRGLGAGTMPEMRAYSCVAAVTQFWLALRAVGLGLGWVSILDPTRLLHDLDLPADWRLIGYFCIGYPRTTSETPELESLGWETRRETVPVLER